MGSSSAAVANVEEIGRRIPDWIGARARILENESPREGELLAERSAGPASHEVVGSARALREVMTQVAKVAPTDTTVLVLGETGTGKELIAHEIQRLSRRAARPFVRVNCAAIPPSLIATELFGHEKGAFTGAVQRRVGRFESAHGGTIFLDEVGDLPMETQIALLRVLQERELERVGGGRPIPIDVRVLAATNRDLEAEVASGAFRRDLYYRLDVFPIRVPPLRDRGDDVALLAGRFVAQHARRLGKRFARIAGATLELLRQYPWPGNVRELQNVIERAVILCEGDEVVVDESWLGKCKPSRAPAARCNGSLAAALADRERELIEAALAESRGRVSGPVGAARILGLPGSTLESKIALLGIDKNQFRRGASPEARC